MPVDAQRMEKLSSLIGRAGTLYIMMGRISDAAPGVLYVPIMVTDVRSAFGRIDLKVTPLGGSGEAWTNLDRVTFAEEEVPA